MPNSGLCSLRLYWWTASAEARRNSSVRTYSSDSGRRTRLRAEAALWRSFYSSQKNLDVNYEITIRVDLIILVDSVRRSPPELSVRTYQVIPGSEARLRAEAALWRAKVEPERIELCL